MFNTEPICCTMEANFNQGGTEFSVDCCKCTCMCRWIMLVVSYLFAVMNILTHVYVSHNDKNTNWE